jgi:hypothetical protein
MIAIKEGVDNTTLQKQNNSICSADPPFLKFLVPPLIGSACDDWGKQMITGHSGLHHSLLRRRLARMCSAGDRVTGVRERRAETERWAGGVCACVHADRFNYDQ